MKTRIHSNRWRARGRPPGPGDNATALAYVIWQIALAAAKNLHAEEFDYGDDRQRIAVIAEYLAFLVHVTDRLLERRLDRDMRRAFLETLAGHVARHYQRNVEEILGRGDHRGPFLALMNERIDDYAGAGFADDCPAYGMLRDFGAHVQSVMGDSQSNRWVIDQVMEIDGPDAVAHLRESLANLLDSSGMDLSQPADRD